MFGTKWFKIFLGRRALVLLSLIVQIALFFSLLVGTGIYVKNVYIVLNIVSVIVCIYLINNNRKAGYKLIWIFLILLAPFFGGILYIVLNFWSNPRKIRKELDKNIKDSSEAFFLPGNRLYELIDTFPDFRTNAYYLQECAGFPVYGNTRQVYFPSGESFFYNVLEELEKAEK